MEHIEKRRYSEMKRSGRRGGMGKGGGTETQRGW